MAQQLMNSARLQEDSDALPGLAQWVVDPGLLWLWCRPAAAALIRPLAWGLPYATGAALKEEKRSPFTYNLILRRSRICDPPPKKKPVGVWVILR